MRAGHSKLVAKIQHFYDTVMTEKERNEDDALSTDNYKEKQYRQSSAECYAKVGSIYCEIFKEFLYNSNEPHND